MKYKDPYEDMSDEEFEGHMLKLLSKPESVSVSIRIPKPLLGRIKAVAGGANQPYQTLMKGILEDAIERLERTRVRRPTRTARAAASKRAAAYSRRTTKRRTASSK